jgi:hypothetical protein
VTGTCALLVVPLLVGACARPAPVARPPLPTPSAPAASSPPAPPPLPDVALPEPALPEPALPEPALPELGPGTHRVDVAGEAALVRMPEQRNGRVVLYAHGYDAEATALLNDREFGAVADGLVAAGYVVAASDAAGDAWGNAASVDAHAALAAAVTDLVDAPEVFLVAESMGGLAGAQMVADRRIEGLRAYAAISPLCDLSSVYDGYTASVDAAHGATVEQALDELSPVALDGAVPVLFWASAADRTVDRERNADVCAAQVVADGGRADVIDAAGRHGDPSTYDLDAMLAFFESAAG